MKQIRRAVFETNSSSTHSIAIFTDKEYHEWINEDLYINSFWGDTTSLYKDKKYVALEEAVDILYGSKHPPDMPREEFMMMESEDQEEHLQSEGFYNRNTFGSYGSSIECDYNEYTSPSGDHLHIVCAYGHD